MQPLRSLHVDEGCIRKKTTDLIHVYAAGRAAPHVGKRKRLLVPSCDRGAHEGYQYTQFYRCHLFTFWLMCWCTWNLWHLYVRSVAHFGQNHSLLLGISVFSYTIPPCSKLSNFIIVLYCYYRLCALQVGCVMMLWVLMSFLIILHLPAQTLWTLLLLLGFHSLG